MFCRLKVVLLHVEKRSCKDSLVHSMKHQTVFLLFCLSVILLTGCRPHASRPGKHQPLSHSTHGVRLIGCTPIKDQGNGELCWAYAMLATIESEHIMKGDSVNLSIAYVVRMLLHEKATEYYFSSGRKKIDMRGVASMIPHYIYKYGIVPYDSYETPRRLNYQVLKRKVEMVCREAIARQRGLAQLHESLDKLLDSEMGYLPGKTVHMLGAEYTPIEFAHSVCYPGEYVSLTSFSHHPFGTSFVLEVPDNTLRDCFLNLPLDALMERVVHAVKNGHPVCWEGDISEREFQQPDDGFVDLPSSELPVTQASRQRAFERLLTTDDHVMEIIGMGKRHGKTYFICRNSWGEQWGKGGCIYLSEDYIRLKTIAVYMSKDAL